MHAIKVPILVIYGSHTNLSPGTTWVNIEVSCKPDCKPKKFASHFHFNCIPLDNNDYIENILFV